jgi:hypothetical protein
MLSKIGALAATFSTASAVYTGFNYGSTNTDGSPVTLEQFTNLFNTARNLAGTNGEFTAARLYTTVQVSKPELHLKSNLQLKRHTDPPSRPVLKVVSSLQSLLPSTQTLTFSSGCGLQQVRLTWISRLPL